MSNEPGGPEKIQLSSSFLQTELEQKVFSLVVQPLYGTEVRKQLRSKHLASDDEIDAVLTSPDMKRALGRSVEAFLQHRLPALLQMIFMAAEKKESWACKLILELTGIAELLHAVVSETEEEILEAQVVSEHEQELVESFRRLVAGEGREEALPESISN